MLLKLFRRSFNKNIVLSLLITTISVFSSIYVYFKTIDDSYKLMFIMPLAYAFCFAIILSKITFNKFRIFYFTFTVIAFLRYVAYPVGTVYVGLYTGRSLQQPSPESFQLAFLLVIYELIAVTLLLVYLSRKDRNKMLIKTNTISEEIQISFPRTKFVYVSFILITFILILIFPKSINNYNFIAPKNINVNALSLTALESLVAIFISVSKQILFLLFISYTYRRYKWSNKTIWIFLSLVLVFMNMSIYSGLNRSDFIMMAISSTYIFGVLYPNYIKRVIMLLIVVLIIVIPSITQVRQMSGIFENSHITFAFTQTMQQYLGSPYNVAIAIEAREIYFEHTHFLNFLYDFIRPTFGFNMLVKNLPFNFSNEYFNYRMYLGDRIVQIIPMIGEGYFYFGFIAAPIITLMFVAFGDWLSKIHLQTQSIELKYFLTITCTRLGFIMGQNASIQMNDLSFTLFVPIMLYWINKKIVLKKKLKYGG